MKKIILISALLSILLTCKAQIGFVKYDKKNPIYSMILEHGNFQTMHFTSSKKDTIISDIMICNRRMFGVVIKKSISNNEPYNVFNNCKYGYVDSVGRIVIQPIYDNAGVFINGLAVVEKFEPSGQYYSWHILPNGQKLYTNRYVDVSPFCNGYAVVDKDGAYHMCHIGKNGKPIYPQTYQWLQDFNQYGKAVGIRNINLSSDMCTWVVINTLGKEIFFYRDNYTKLSNQSTYPKALWKYLK